MTSLIYRGFSHDGVREPRPVTSQNLTYRSVRHSGHAAPVLKPTHVPEMIYRSVRHTPRTAGMLETGAPLFGGVIAPVSSIVIGQAGHAVPPSPGSGQRQHTAQGVASAPV